MKLSLAILFAAGCTGSVQVQPVQPAPPPPQPVVVERTAPPPVVVVAEPSKHPAYLHALTDLRAARGYLRRPAGAMVKWDENRAIREIDAAIKEIKVASIDDGKNIEDHPMVDDHMVWGGRLQKSLELIESARRDINQEEDNGFANGLKVRAIQHIDGAANAIHEGMADAHVQPTVVVVEAPPPPPPPPPPAGHPAYLHALTDLRAARSFLRRPAGAVVKWDENRAIREIDGAIKEIKIASIDDGKNVEDHPPVDDHMVWGNRLQKALELVETARRDVNQDEDNGFARGLKNRAIQHIDGAARAIKDGMNDAFHGAPPPVVVVEPAPPVVVVGPTDHPAYLHAISDLRFVRALLERPAHPEVKWDETNAVHEIDEALREIKAAAIDDGKPLADHPIIDAKLHHRDRLRQAEEGLHKAAADIEQREDNNFAKGLRARALGHIRNAEHAVHEAMADRGH